MSFLSSLSLDVEIPITVYKQPMCACTSQSKIGNWSVEVGGSALSWPQGSSLQVQARLDGAERIWLNGTAEGRCLRTTAGHTNGKYRIISVIFSEIFKL